MLSPLATLLLTWAAIYTYVGAYYCMLHARRPTHREYLAFGLLCFSLTFWSVGSVLLAEASSAEEAAHAIRLQYAGGFAATAFFVEFAAEIAGRSSRRLVWSAYGWCAVGLVFDTAGWLTSARPSSSGPDWGLSFGRVLIGPTFSPLGTVMVLGALLLSAAGVFTIARGVANRPDLRWLVAASAIALGAAVHDAVARWFRFSTVPLVEHAGLVPVLTVSFLLLRRFVGAADELGKRTDELRQSYSELRVTQEELVRKEQLAAVGELSAVIAHEVRNPLAIIKNAASSLRRPPLRAADRTLLLGILDEEVDRLSRLVRDLLAYARPVEPRGRALDLDGVIHEAVGSALGHHPAPDTVDVRFQTQRCPTIHGDPDLLRQALANVVDNALSAMPDGGVLTVRTRERRHGREPGVEVELTDTGAGMEPAVLAKAKDPFFTTRPSGTGLGLAIVERVIKNHGGRIEVDSVVGEGTTVRVRLPLERLSSVPPPPDDDDEEGLR